MIAIPNRLSLFAEKHGFPIALISAVYTLAWWGLLSFPDAVFWDDWTLFGQDAVSILSHFEAAGAPWAGFINLFFVSIGPGATRGIVFASSLVALILWYFIMDSVPSISRKQAMLGSAIAGALPLFLAKVAAINTISTIAQAIFLAGWLFFIHAGRGKPLLKVSLAFIFMLMAGFLYNAFFFLAPAPLIHSLWLERGRLDLTLRFRVLSFGFGIFGTAVIVYLAGPILFPLSGIYSTYRALEFGVEQFAFAVLGVLLVGIFFHQLRGGLGLETHVGRSETFQVTLFALLVGWLAVLPYALLGFFPPFQEWQTRYEVNLFMPIGLLGALFFGKIRRVFPLRLATAVSAISLSVALVVSNLSLADFRRDVRKHEYIKSLLIEGSQALEGSYVVFIDQSESLNAMNRNLRFYEWSGLLSEVTGSQTTFGIRGEDPHLSYAAYLSGYQEPYLNAVYNYYWRNHAFPAGLSWVIIEESPISRCSLFESDFSGCLEVEIAVDSLEAEN